MSTREAKDRLFDGFGAVAGGMASGRRAELVDVLAQGPRSVEELAGEIGQSVANTSHHLRTLARAGLVRSSRDGTRIRYELSSPRVTDLWRALREVAAEQLAEVDRLARGYLGDRGGFDPLPREELARRLEDGDVVLLDVRPRSEYAAGHVAGARSVPLDELSDRIGELDSDGEIVAYCRGPYCVFADDAVRQLRRSGLSAERLEDGFPEWRDAGLPVAFGEPAQ